jgi:hypothetical protein
VATTAPKSNRTVLVVLFAVLIIAIAGVAYFAVKRNSTTTTTPNTVATPSPIPSPAVADAALAATINLHLTDLPAGWAQSTTVNQQPRPPLAPPAAQVRATQALAGCLAQPVAMVSGLFGNSALPGQTAAARSPTFQSDSDPGIQMVSETTVMQTTADAHSRYPSPRPTSPSASVGTSPHWCRPRYPGPPPRCRRCNSRLLPV